MMKFNAIVSGGTKGIGLEITKYLADRGYVVLALYKDDTRNAESVFKTYSLVHPFKCDITKKNEMENLEDYLAIFGSKPTVLVNNAGFNSDSLFWKMPENQWDRVLDVTLKGAYNLSQLVVPHMRYFKRGTIINISSVVSQIGVAGTVNYSTAKAGLDGFTRSLAKELAPKEITVNTLALGYFNTGIIKSVPNNDLIKIIRNIPLNRLGEADDLKSAIAFLLDCKFFTGQTLNVNGGLYA